MKEKGSALIGVIIAIVAILLILIIAYVGTYNSIVSLEEKVDKQYSSIKVQLQRRADFIPNLVDTVKGYMKHEESVINEITEARKEMTSAKDIKEMSKANDKLTAALNSLNVIVENYPDLKANTTFIRLQDELAGTENRIATARRDYNEAVNAYNTKIKKMPASIIASMMGRQPKDYFDVTDSSKEEVPEVDFGN